MNIEECKCKAAEIGQRLCGGMVADTGRLPDDWAGLATQLGNYAAHAEICASELDELAQFARMEAIRTGT